jgi:protein O-GlcNAc transferase
MTLQEQLESGISHHRAGRLPEAEKVYRQILARHPNHAEALHLLGVLASQVGKSDAAVELIRRAVALRPDFAEAHYNLGITLSAKGQIDEAISSFRQVVRINPDSAEAHYGLATALQAQGKLDEAIASHLRAIQIKPDYDVAHYNLGNALRDKGRLDEAIASYRTVIRLKPDYADAYNNLGIALKDIERVEEAIASFRQAIQIKPDMAEAHSNLAGALTLAGQFEDAIAACREAIRINPGFADAHINLCKALTDAGRFDEAMPLYHQAIRMRPDFPGAYNGLGNLSHDLGQLDEAIAVYRQSIELKPADADAHGNLLFSLNYHPNIDADQILAEHRAWADRHAHPLMGNRVPHSNDRAPERRLRIGYVSPDFRRHSVGYFTIPLLEHHDHQIFEIFCYSNVLRPDNMTERMKRYCDAWRNIVGVADDAVANMVRSDGIDILVDLAGHTAGGRLLIFARKPAPIQLTYLGYPNTTGMMAMDYRLTDALADPPGLTDHLNIEKLWRLPTCAWCYGPLEDAPDIRPRADGPITFGSFNAFAKINPKLTAIWAKLLNLVPESRLLLKSAGAGEASSRRRLTDQLAAHGISGERIEMIGRIADPRGHLQSYHRVDVALDTYPYHGTTTSCEAMWMGVPVITIAGQAHISRVGVSLLSNVGLPELIAQSPEEYVSIAADLARDLPRLTELRRTLRSRMRASPLMDARRFARNLEAAYRQMWRNWCEQTLNSGLQCPAR